MALPRYVPHYSMTDYEMWEGRWELWSGVPVALSPVPDRRHQEISGNVYFALRQAVAAAGCTECTVLYEIDWRISDDTVVRPDILITCGPRETKWVQTLPEFVAEVLSESTRERDLHYKLKMYETLGVKYYMILDPKDGTYQILRNSDAGFETVAQPVLQLHERCQIQPSFDHVF